ncbi:MAG: SusC/RagA family TonB-linked outer membrane protein, partial [Bacteroides sp.]|nr:SusC/RagA family TonB-linked outer membrane protein [Bacteroides sp.]
MKKELLLFMCLLFLAGTIHGQETINLNEKNSTVLDIITKIQKKTEYRFFYGPEMPDLEKEITISLSDASIQDILTELETQTDLSFRFLDEYQIIAVPEGSSMESATIRGKVTSGSDPDGVPGANVVLKGTTQGVITGADGNFEIEVPDKYSVLQVSFIGLETQEIALNGRDMVNVEMGEDLHSIDEVVVTALNRERDKSSLGYSVSQVGGDAINQAKENNPVNSLAGKVAGLSITKSPTGVDGSSRVVLRGVASLLGNNRPLFVIDGIPMDAGFGGGGRWGGKDNGDALADLNPEDIESMSVLKGAGAAAAYGSRGANGVIIITTKKGTKRKGIGVSFSSSYTMETPMVSPEFQYDYAQGAFGDYPAMTGSPHDHPWIWSYGPKMTGQEALDWLGEPGTLNAQANPFDVFFRKGSSFTNSLALTGGNEVATFRASITNQNSKGLLPNNDISRQTINMRGTSKLGDKLSIDGKITYIRSKGNNRPHLAESGLNTVQVLSILPRSISLESLEQNQEYEDGSEISWSSDKTFSNPYWVLNNTGNEDEKHRVQAMLSMNWDIVKGLDLMVRSGLDYSNKRGKDWENPGRPSVASGVGSMSQSMSNGTEWNSDLLLTYNKKWENITMNLSAGGNYRYNDYISVSQSGSSMRIRDFYHIS